MSTPVKKRKLADEVQERLLAIIRSGSLQPGDTLPSERELMADYQVGRPAIREAMQNLQHLGLVEIRHGERPRVAEPSMDTMVSQISQTMHHLLTHSETSMTHLKEARATFEAEMARAAARNRNDEAVAGLRQIVAKQASFQDDPAAFMRCDREFHGAVASMSGNPIFEKLALALFGWLVNFHIDLVHKQGAEDLTLHEHTAIIDAIDTGDAEHAATTMKNHLNRTNKLYHQSYLSTS